MNADNADKIDSPFVPTDRFAGQCLIASSIIGLLVMALHPTGAQMFAHFELITRLNIAVHSIALLAMPVSFIGAIAISGAISRRAPAFRNLGISALVFYGFATLCVIIAGAASGLIAPRIAARLLDPTLAPDRAVIWRTLFHFAGDLNQTFARVFVVGVAIAIILWSMAIFHSHAFARGLAIYGFIFGIVSALATASGYLPMNIHGFGAVMLGHAIWFIIVGKALIRPQPPQ
jgi:hypothetical protein